MSNYSTKGNYLPDEQFMNAIVTECGDRSLDASADEAVVDRCGWYIYILNIFFGEDSLESNRERLEPILLSNTRKSNILWLMNNTWQSNR